MAAMCENSRASIWAPRNCATVLEGDRWKTLLILNPIHYTPSLLTSSSELWASERFRFSTISVELERFEFDDVATRSSCGASVSNDEVHPRFDRRDAHDTADADAAVLVVVVVAVCAAAAAAAATADGPLITSSSSSELC